MQSSRSIKSRCICSNSVPPYLNDDLQVLREELRGKELSSLETKWYESLFIDRLKRLTALHSIGITHGDIKEDCFRLLDDFHDTVLFDFSHAYTITLQRPHAVQGHIIDSRYSERWSIWRSMEKLVALERNWLRSLINQRCVSLSSYKRSCNSTMILILMIASKTKISGLDTGTHMKIMKKSDSS